MADRPEDADGLTKYAVALIVAVTGMLITATIVCVLAFKDKGSSEITAIAGVFTTLTGTLVGTFLGVQAAGSGKEKSAQLAQKALAALPPEKAEEIMRSTTERSGH